MHVKSENRMERVPLNRYRGALELGRKVHAVQVSIIQVASHMVGWTSSVG